jgi:DNA-binding protein
MSEPILTEEKQKKQKIPDNVIFVGKKPFMSYIQAAQYQLKENPTIEICARGKNISRAVDIAEVLEKRFMKGEIEKVEIKTDSEMFESKESNGKKISVSTIKIILKIKTSLVI